MILAQTTGPALWPSLEHFALAATTAAAIGSLIVALRKKERREISPQPLTIRAVEISAAEPTCLARHVENKERIGKHDRQIENLWNTVREENTKIRGEMTAVFARIERGMGRIEGKIDKANGFDTQL